MKTLTAYSESLKKEFAVTISIEADFSIRERIEIGGELFGCRLTHVKGQPCAEIGARAIRALLPGNKSTIAQLKLRADWTGARVEVLREAERLKAEAKAEKIVELRESGQLLYVLTCGGDSHEYAIDLGYKDSASNFKPEWTGLIVIESRKVLFEDVKGVDFNAGARNYAVAGFYGDVWILSKEQYDEITRRADERKVAIKQAQKAENVERVAKFAAAKRTGQAVYLHEVANFEPCAEAGCVDIYKYYAMPDGSTKEERVHTY